MHASATANSQVSSPGEFSAPTGPSPGATFTLGPNQILAALAIGSPDCGPDDPTTTTTSVPPAEPIASPARFTG